MMIKPDTKHSLRWLVHSAGIALLVATAYAAAQPQATEAIVVEQSPSLVTFAGGTEKAAGQLKVRIDGPDGQTVYESASEAGILDWVPQADLPDGRYRWDAWFVPQSALNQLRDERHAKQHAGGSKPAYQSGVFRLEGGTLIMPEENLPKPDQARMSWPEHAIGRLLQTLIPTASADQTISDATPELFFQDTSTADGDDWIIQGQGEPTSLFGIGESLFPQFQIEGGAPVGSLVVDTTGNIGLGTDEPAVELEIADTVPRMRFTDTDASTAWTVSASADEFRLQDNAGGSRPFIVDAGTDSDGAPINSLYIESPTGDIGMGTSTPQRDIHVSAAAPGLRLDNTGLGGGSWDVQVGSSNGSFFITDVTGGSTPLGISAGGAPTGSLWVSSTGDVGMGTSSPAKHLHVQGADSGELGANNVMARIENTIGTEKSRRMLELVNNGSPLLVYRNSNSGETWSQNPVGGQFTITKGGTGQQEFQMDGGGNVTIQGSLTQNSMRSSKQGFGSVDADTVLAKLDQLAIEEWSYKHTPDSRHMSPMAEDFYTTFGLGPKNGIAPTDLAGVALAAAKALKAENEALKAKVAKMAQMESRLETLEKRLAELDR